MWSCGECSFGNNVIQISEVECMRMVIEKYDGLTYGPNVPNLLEYERPSVLP